MPRATADLDEGHDRRVAGTDAGVPAETPPGPDGFPIVGNARSLVRDPRAFYEAMSEYGDVVSSGIVKAEVVFPENVVQQFDNLHADTPAQEYGIPDPELGGEWELKFASDTMARSGGTIDRHQFENELLTDKKLRRI